MRIQHYLSVFLFHFLFFGAAAQQISDFAPKLIIGGKGEILKITGTGFGNARGSSYVSFYQELGNYTDAATGNGFNYLNWNNTEIWLEMPNAFSNRIKLFIGGKEILSVDSLRIKANLGYRQPNPLLYDLLTDRNQKGGITWLVHSAYWNNSEIKQAIADVVQEFRCKTGVNYVIEPMQEWLPLNLNNGKHIIAPDSGLGVVGYNDKLWSSCVVGSETFYHNQTQLLRFNTQQNWYYGKGKAPTGMSKFRYVLMHEMGHSLGLGHVNEPGETMYPSVTLLPSDNWNERDTITNYEQNAIKHYVAMCQNFGFKGCGITPMKTNIDCKDVYGILTHIQKQESGPYLLSPNPCTGYFRVNTQNQFPLEISISDMEGKLVFNGLIDEQAKIEIPTYIYNGLYVVIIKSENGINYEKIIVYR